MARIKQILAALSLCVLVLAGCQPAVLAAQSSSTHYSVDEVHFGSGGDLNDCSTSYCAKTSAGELVVGNTKSSNYQAQGGFNTNREELLEVSVNGGPIDLGYLDATATHTGSTTFSVRNYLSSGYSVIVSGTTPHTATHTLTTLATQTAAQVGVEQFGINLVKNTSPAVGADVQQVPDSTFSFGAPAAAYGTANQFRYVNGDTIAQSASSSGQTIYTLSMIANVSTSTPSGAYTGALSIIVTPTF